MSLTVGFVGVVLGLVLGGISGFGGTIILSVPGRIALARTMRGKFLPVREEDTPTTVTPLHGRRLRRVLRRNGRNARNALHLQSLRYGRRIRRAQVQVADFRITYGIVSHIEDLKTRCKRPTECDNRRNKAFREGKMSEKCSDNNQKCEYESIGTLSYRASSEISLFFVPDSDHLLKYSANSYAVFVGPQIFCDSEDYRKALTVRLRDDDDGIVLKKSIPIRVSPEGNAGYIASRTPGC